MIKNIAIGAGKLFRYLIYCADFTLVSYENQRKVSMKTVLKYLANLAFSGFGEALQVSWWLFWHQQCLPS